MLLFEISRVEFFFKAAPVIDGPSRSCFVLLRLYEALACAVLCALWDAPPFGFMTHPTTILNTCQHGKSYPTSRGLGGRRRKKGKRKKKKKAALATALKCLAWEEICASFESDGRLVRRRVHLQSLTPLTKVCGTTHRSENSPSFSSQRSHLVQVHLFVCCSVYVKWGQTERHALAGGRSPARLVFFSGYEMAVIYGLVLVLFLCRGGKN